MKFDWYRIRVYLVMAIVTVLVWYFIISGIMKLL